MRGQRTLTDVKQLPDVLLQLNSLANASQVADAAKHSRVITRTIGPSKTDATLVATMVIKERSLDHIKDKHVAIDVADLDEVTGNMGLAGDGVR